MPNLLIASNNKGKIIEFRYLFKDTNYTILSPSELGINLDVAETGSSYDENARIKAQAFCRAGRIFTLADDSGLEVDALGGEPGIRSSRYAGEHARDVQRVEFLLQKLKDVPEEKRTARFCCVIALVWPDGRLEYCRGKCEGQITLAPRGNEGFGYDPVFCFPELGKTMAELPAHLKNKISHRARAAAEARKLLLQL